MSDKKLSKEELVKITQAWKKESSNEPTRRKCKECGVTSLVKRFPDAPPGYKGTMSMVPTCLEEGCEGDLRTEGERRQDREALEHQRNCTGYVW